MHKYSYQHFLRGEGGGGGGGRSQSSSPTRRGPSSSSRRGSVVLTPQTSGRRASIGQHQSRQYKLAQGQSLSDNDQDSYSGSGFRQWHDPLILVDQEKSPLGSNRRPSHHRRGDSFFLPTPNTDPVSLRPFSSSNYSPESTLNTYDNLDVPSSLDRVVSSSSATSTLAKLFNPVPTNGAQEEEKGPSPPGAHTDHLSRGGKDEEAALSTYLSWLDQQQQQGDGNISISGEQKHGDLSLSSIAEAPSFTQHTRTISFADEALDLQQSNSGSTNEFWRQSSLKKLNHK